MKFNMNNKIMYKQKLLDYGVMSPSRANEGLLGFKLQERHGGLLVQV